MGGLQGKVAVITGGAGGIGLAAARRFVAEGARVILVDMDEASLRDAMNALGSQACSYCRADVSQSADTERYIKHAIQKFGGIDILLANAGIEGEVKPIPECSIDVFERVMAVNVTGVFLAMKFAIPVMRARGGGAVVITSSTSGIRGASGRSQYTTSKHALIGLMRSAALECAGWNIRVNAINPAPVETRMMRSLEALRATATGSTSAESIKSRLANGIPMKRYGAPEEVAEMLLFLSSDASSFCTGGVYMIDGGVSAGAV